MKENDIDKLIDRLFEEELSRIEVPEDLESRLGSLIDGLDEAERQRPNRRSIRLWAGSIAAAIAIVVTVGSLYLNKETDKPSFMVVDGVVTIIDDPEVAYAETVKALELVSRNFNKGMDGLAQAEEEINKVNTILDKTFKDIKR